MESTAILERHTVARGHIEPCPTCGGRGYDTIEIRESVTICADSYPVTYPVVGYKTVGCWRCRGTGRVPLEVTRWKD